MNGNGTFQLPPQASTVAPDIDALYYFIFWTSAFFFLLIVGISLYFVLKYQRRPGVQKKARSFHNTPMEVTWTVVPTALVLIVFVWGFKGYMNLSIAPGNSLDYYVTGKKWMWEITAPNGNVGINEMTVPVNQPVKVILRSDDLVHSFFIPAFRVKQDAVPNRYNTLWFEAVLPGEYDIFCTEYCGTGHSQMLGKVKVLDEAAWEEYQKTTLTRPADMTLAQWGGKIYETKACITCHSLDGSAKTGPTFKGLFGHSVPLADGGSVVADEDYLRRSILEPASQVVAGFQPVMPTYAGTLTPEDVDGLVAFIKEQQ